MPGPRANFECANCQGVYEDLPIACVRCPVCNRKRGFRRLFDAINIGTGAAPRNAGLQPHVDASMRAKIDGLIQPMLEQRDALRNGRAAQAGRDRELRDRMAAANVPMAPEMPQAPVGAPRMPQGAAGLMNLISPESRQLSRDLNGSVLAGLRQYGKPRPLIVGNDPTPVPQR